MTFNEDSRVKLPAILQFRRLGYIYQSKKNQNIQKHNNIFMDVFKSSIREINGKDYSDEQLDDTIKQIETLTDNRRDKGKGFYDRLKAYHDMMLVNLEEPEKNDFRVVTELPFKGERDVTFRPDITVLVNGIPMAFVEAKKPNNKDGIQAEFKRMKERTDDTHMLNASELCTILQQEYGISTNRRTIYTEIETLPKVWFGCAAKEGKKFWLLCGCQRF